MYAARRFLRVGRASSFCGAFAIVVAAPAIAADEGAPGRLFVRLDLGVMVEHATYRRTDRALVFSGLPPSPTPYIVQERSLTSYGVPLRADLGVSLGRGVVLALSGELSYLAVNDASGYFSAGISGYARAGVGLSTIYRPASARRVHLRIGCLYALIAPSASGSDVGSVDNTYQPEELRGMQCHLGGGFDVFHGRTFDAGPAVRLDAGHLKNGYSFGSSSFDTIGISLTFGVTFR